MPGRRRCGGIRRSPSGSARPCGYGLDILRPHWNQLARWPLVFGAQPTEVPMGSTTDKIKGYANQAVGNAKEKIGQATGSGKTETQGNVQSIKGKAQVATGKAKDTIKKAVD